MAAQMQVSMAVTPVFNNALIQAQGAASGAAYANSFKAAFSKTQPLGRITGSVSEFEKSMEAANARVIAFGTSAGSIYLVKVAFEKLITSTIQTQKSLASINAILNLGGTALKGFSSEMFKAAAATGQTFETASKVALEFARHGVSATETVKRMTAAMQLMRISGLGAEESVNVMTAAINAFNREGLTASDVVNRLTAVDTRFAISAQDLAKAIQRVGSTAEEAGVHFNQLLGLVTAAQTATARGGAVIGNAFKSIFTRLSRPQVLADLESIGVIVKDSNQQILPMVSILKNLAQAYNTLNPAQKSFITEAVGGVYQVNILKASLADLGNGISIFDKASIAASQSAGLIDERMSQLNETIDSKLNTSVVELTKLFSSFGQIAFADKARSGLDSLNSQIHSLSESLESIGNNDSGLDKFIKTFSSGIAKGFGSILSGPIVQVISVLITKSLGTLGKFVLGISEDFLGINDTLHRQQAILGSIQNFLATNRDLVQEVAMGQKTVNDLNIAYSQQLQEQIIATRTILNLKTQMAATMGPNLATSAITPAVGFIPHFSEGDSERMGAAQHGYLAGATYKKQVFDGRGNVFSTTVNQAETIKEFINSAGHRATMVIPPNGFGSDTIRANMGFIPNFGENEDIFARYRNSIQNLHAFNLNIEEELVKHGATKQQASAFKNGIFRSWNHGQEEPPVSQFLLNALTTSTGSRGIELLDRFKNENRFKNELYGKTIGLKGIDFSLVEQRMEELRNQKKISAAGFAPNFSAPDYVFSMLGMSRGTRNSVFGQKTKVQTDKFEKELYEKLVSHPELGFSNLLHLSSNNHLLKDISSSLGKNLDLHGNNARADFFGMYKGEPMFFDAKHTGYYDMTVGKLTEKTGSMQELYHAIQSNPEILKRLTQSADPMGTTMRFGSIVPRIPLPAMLKHWHESGIKYVNLNQQMAATGFAPNFATETLWRGVGGSRIKKHIETGNPITPEVLKNIIFSPKKPDSRFSELIDDAFYTAPGVNKDAIIDLLSKHQSTEDNSVRTGLLSTSRRWEVATRFGGKTDEKRIGEMRLPFSRIITNNKLDKLLNRVGPARLSKIIENRKKFIGFDVNSFVDDKTYRDENEVALYAKGFAPNFSPIQNAIKREMDAGYSSSEIRVGKDSSLVSSLNPNGVGIYNSTEGSLSKGIGLAKAAGINPKTKGMASGFVPSFFDSMETSIMLGVLQSAVGGLSSKIGKLSIGYDKEISQKQEAYEAFNKLIGELRATPAAQRKANDELNAQRDFTKQHGFDPIDVKTAETHQTQYGIYEASIRKTQQNISKYSIGAMIGAPMVGGLISSGLQNTGHPDASNLMSGLSEGATQAAQALFALQNKAGVALAGFLAAGKISEGLSEFAAHTGTANKVLDLAKTRLENLSSSISAVMQSYETQKSLFDSGGASMAQFISLSKVLTQSFTELASVQGGAKIARELAGAGTTEKRQEIGARAIDLQQNATEEAELNAAFAARRAKHPFVTGGAQGVFTAGSKGDLPEIKMLLNKSALLSQGQTLTELLNSGDVNTKKETQGTIARLSQQEGKSSDVDFILKNLQKSSFFTSQKPSEQNDIRKQLEYQLKSVTFQPSAGASPEQAEKEYQEHLKSIAELRKADVQELAIRRQYNQELQNLVSKGIIVSNFEAAKSRQGFVQQGRELSTAFSGREAQNQLSSLFTSETEVLRVKGATNKSRIEQETTLESTKNRTEGAQNLGIAIGKAAGESFIEMRGAPSKLTNAGEPEALTAPNANLSKFISERQQAFAGNKATQLLDAFQNNGAKGLAETFLGDKDKAKSSIGETNYNILSSNLQAKGGTEDILNIIQETLLKANDINKNGLTKLSENEIETLKAISEAKFKELAESLGGLSLLTTKGADRQLRRRIHKDEILKHTGANAEIRGRAAVDLLKLIPEGQRDRSNPYIKELLTTGISGMQMANQRGLRNASPEFSAFFSNPNMASAQVMEQIKTFDSKHPNETNTARSLELQMPAINLDTSPLKHAVDESALDIGDFGKNLKHLGDQLPRLFAAWQNIQVSNAKKVTEINQGQGNAIPPREPPISSARGWGEAGLEVGKQALGSAVSLGGYIAYDKFKNRNNTAKESVSGKKIITPKGFTPANDLNADPLAGLRKNEYSPKHIEALKRVAKEGTGAEKEMAAKAVRDFESRTGLNQTFKSYTAEEVSGITGVTKGVSSIGKAVKIGGKALGIAGVGFGAYDTIRDLRAGNKADAAVDALSTGLSFTGIGLPAAVAAPIVNRQLGQLRGYNNTIQQQEGISKNQDLLRVFAADSKRLGIPSLESFKGNREALGQYLNAHTAPNTPDNAPSAKAETEKASGNGELLGKLQEINVGIASLKDSMAKGLTGNLTANLGIDKTQFVAFIKSVVAGNAQPAKMPA